MVNNIEQLDEAPRFKIVKVRIRKGKVQRRKKISNVKGYTFRKKGSGPSKLTRMTSRERMNRKRSQRRGKLKRRTKLARFRVRLKRSLMRRKAMGL